MTTTYPTALDTFQNPGALTMMDAGAGLDHDVQHANINDAVAALQAKVGVDASAVVTSLDYKVAANAAAIIVVASNLAAHVAGVDPHGDRAFATAAISTHAAASDPHGDRAFATAAISTHTAASDPHGDRAFATAAISTHSGAVDPHGDRAYALGLANAAVSAAESYSDSQLAGHVVASDPHGDRAYADAGDATTLSAAEGYADAGDASTLSSANGFTTSAISTHAAASDPHGDRAFATSAIATHAAASDPHGDRAFATAAIATHAGAADPHGDRAFATSADTAAIAAHVAASDPHGDRAFATSAISTHNGVTTAHGISAYGATLVDDADASTARGTLGLGGAAVLSVGTTAGTVAAGDHNHAALYQPLDADLTTLAAVTPGALGLALLDDATAGDGRTTLGLGTMATQAATAVAITGGTIDGTVIGGTTKAAGSFTTLAGRVTDAGTTTVVAVATFSHASSGTAAAGLGVAINLEAQSSTGAMRQQGGISSEWIVATDATRRATVRHYANDFNGPTEYLIFQTDGAAGGTATANYEWRFTSSTTSTDPSTGAVVVGGGLGVGTQIHCGGAIYHGDSTFVIHASSALDNGAAASVGTLTNAPAAGNPTKWLKIDDAGTTRYIPAW